MSLTYEPPQLVALGSLTDVTAACQGFGGEDGAAKSDDPFVSSSPDFGDPGFCNP